MKLDATNFRYITKEEFRILSAVEMGMRNHELVPVQLIESIAHNTRGSTYKILQSLLRNKLLAHDGKKYDGYRMTYHGYDFLALRALVMRGTITSVGRRLGVGKESDVHYCSGPSGEVMALKLHRLGRISFRAIKEKRDYLGHRQHASWMYMARLAAMKEFAYMKALRDEGFPVPKPIDQNRHAVVMSFVKGVPLYHIRDMEPGQPQVVLERLMRLLVRLARAGIVHGDFNEFNLMIDEENRVTLIDFPQIIALSHANARETFERDVRSTCDFFRKRLNIEVEEYPEFEEVLKEIQGAGGKLAELAVEGLRAEDDALLVSAHGKGQQEAVDQDAAGEDDDDDEEDDDSDEDDGEDEDEKKKKGEESVSEDGLAKLLPEGGAEALGTPDDELAEADVDAALAAAAPLAGESDEKDEATAEPAESSSGEESEGPGQVTVNSGRKVRKRQTAKEARKNLQKQQKAKPAKPNNQKVKEMRRAKHEVKEYFA